MSVFADLFSSKKFMGILIGLITVVLVNFLGLSEDQAAAIADRVVILVGTYVAAQGIADHGKGKAVVETAAVAAPAPAAEPEKSEPSED